MRTNIRILLIGSSEVGKFTLIKSILEKEIFYIEKDTNFKLEFNDQHFEINLSTDINLYDLNYFDIIWLMFSVDNIDSYQYIKNLYLDKPVILLENKIDLTYQDELTLCQKLFCSERLDISRGYHHYITDAKNGINCDKPFLKSISIINEKKESL